MTLIKVNIDGRDKFYVKDPAKIAMYEMLAQNSHYHSIKIQRVKE